MPLCLLRSCFDIVTLMLDSLLSMARPRSQPVWSQRHSRWSRCRQVALVAFAHAHACPRTRYGDMCDDIQCYHAQLALPGSWCYHARATALHEQQPRTLHEQ
jgi:hypothetical protein